MDIKLKEMNKYLQL